jgi:hypothetical protein
MGHSSGIGVSSFLNFLCSDALVDDLGCGLALEMCPAGRRGLKECLINTSKTSIKDIC